MPQSRYLQSPGFLPLRDAFSEADIESQDSQNENSMLSEPVIPPLDGFPNVREFDQLMKSYVDDLSVKKQDKALIHAKRARNIKTVLMDPKDTAVESAQFRFWVKKMFKLQTIGTGTSDGSEGTYFTLCQDMSDLPSASRGSALDTSEFEKKLTSPRGAVPFTKVTIAAYVKA
ncbi:hypothetical protein AnigIFM60653_006644 [Aspergillus niger]|nr:hypothetical protein AnigIFM49718_006925 [Aspergillus niger]GLA06121.1 hypothetical protein AnigIFM60653_006644 [Aspergillus niger]GLA43865.1 hypothetical protein AnigIFM63309_001960 [Aspergillus niger]